MSTLFKKIKYFLVICSVYVLVDEKGVAKITQMGVQSHPWENSRTCEKNIRLLLAFCPFVHPTTQMRPLHVYTTLVPPLYHHFRGERKWGFITGVNQSLAAYTPPPLSSTRLTSVSHSVNPRPYTPITP